MAESEGPGPPPKSRRVKIDDDFEKLLKFLFASANDAFARLPEGGTFAPYPESYPSQIFKIKDVTHAGSLVGLPRFRHWAIRLDKQEVVPLDTEDEDDVWYELQTAVEVTFHEVRPPDLSVENWKANLPEEGEIESLVYVAVGPQDRHDPGALPDEIYDTFRDDTDWGLPDILFTQEPDGSHRIQAARSRKPVAVQAQNAAGFLTDRDEFDRMGLDPSWVILDRGVEEILDVMERFHVPDLVVHSILRNVASAPPERGPSMTLSPDMSYLNPRYKWTLSYPSDPGDIEIRAFNTSFIPRKPRIRARPAPEPEEEGEEEGPPRRARRVQARMRNPRARRW